MWNSSKVMLDTRRRINQVQRTVRRAFKPILTTALLTGTVQGLAAGTGLQCKVVEKDVFKPQQIAINRVELTSKSGVQLTAIVYEARLKVNTDGAPNSYHTQDLTGVRVAINTLCNAMEVFDAGHKDPLDCDRALPIIRQFVANRWQVPQGYRIEWQNVIAATIDPITRTSVPCVFSSGEYKGFFGSLTALRNGVSRAEGGECERFDQLDQRYIPALVIPGGDNPVQRMGIKVGDLVLVINPRDRKSVAALVGDLGPAHNLGEGSVALNMALLGKTRQPNNRFDALDLDTSDQKVRVITFKATSTYELSKPFTPSNIASRVKSLLAKADIAEPSMLADAIEVCPN